MKARRTARNSRRAASLIVTLLCLTVLTIIVVAFLQSMSIERKTAFAYSNITRAQLAAESGQNEAITRLSGLMTALPYHAVGYTNVSIGGGTNQLFPILLGAASPTNAPKPFFLCSSTNSTASILNFTNIPNGLNADNSTPVNRRTDDGSINDPGWMGSPVTNGNIQYRECRAPWVYILQDASLPHQPNRGQANYNPYVARYAWWIEDETSKLDITQAGNNEGSGGSFRAAPATNLVDNANSFRDAPITRPSLLDIGAAPILSGAPIGTTNNAQNNILIKFRNDAANLPHDGRLLAQAPDPKFATSEQKARFYTTFSSIANDLAGNGMRRVNLNAIVTDDSDHPNVIKSDLDDIAFVITGTHIYPGLDNDSDEGFFHNVPADINSAVLPRFGNRFWPDQDNSRIAVPGGISAALKQTVYMTKIAANIRDYIDDDSMPTFVDKAGAVVAGRDPGMSPGAPPAPGVFPLTAEDGSRNNLRQPYAIGKEAIPYLIKHAWSFGSGTKWISYLGSGNLARQTDLMFDQYFTFFNPSTKDFVAPAGTFLRVFKRMKYDISTGIGLGGWQMNNFEVDLTGIRFPAGMATVITTAPLPPSAPPPTGTVYLPEYGTPRMDPAGGNYSVLLGEGNPGAVWRVTNTIRHSPNVNEDAGSAEAQEGTRIYTDAKSADGKFKLIARGYGGGGSHDWQTQMMWGTPQGYLGGFSAITMTSLGSYTISGPNQRISTVTTMRGNDAASHSGDARSLEEPFSLCDPYLTGNANGDQDQYRFYSSINNPQPLSSARNDLYLQPPGGNAPWPDYTPYFNDTAATAISTSYAVIRDQPMTSIGELGNVYDPYRRNGNNSGGDNNTGYIDYARGGGRTLKIGQADDVIVAGTGRSVDVSNAIAAPRFTPGWFNAAWRLTDIFDVVFDSTGGTTQTVNRTAPEAAAQSLGKFNINSVLRDEGVALRAALRKFDFLGTTPHTDPNLVGRSLSETELGTLIQQIKTYLSSKGPMMERGELSQIQFFSTGTAGARAMTQTMDRGREEIFRRILPMVTTRSSSYSIFTLGQAVQEDTNGKITVTGESLKGNVYRLDPKIAKDVRSKVTSYTATSLYERL